MGISVPHPEVSGEDKPFLISCSNPAGLRYSSVVVILALWGAIYLAAMFTPALLDDVEGCRSAELDVEEQKQMFGESLPMGLRLVRGEE